MGKIKPMFVLAVMVLLLMPAAVWAQPKVCKFYGEVTLDGEPVPDGTIVRAWVEGEVINEIKTIGSDYNINVPPGKSEKSFAGKTVKFTIKEEDIPAGSAKWEAGGVKKFDLAAITITTFSVTNLSISKGTIKPGESTTISVDVQNTGNVEGTHKVELSVNGEVVEVKSVTLSPGKTETIPFTISEEEVGTYSVTVDGQSGSFEVEKPPMLKGDINEDSKVGLKDLAVLASVYGKTSGEPDFLPEADLNDDGKIGLEDLAILGKNWTKEEET